MTPMVAEPVKALAVGERLLTAEEFLHLPEDGRPKELVRGRVVCMNVPAPRHGQICVQTCYLLRRFLDDHPSGHVVSNDSGVITERGPDTVRGADVAFYSYARIPPGSLPRGYLSVVPELIFEVRSPTDRWAKILAKVSEYLEAGVTVVCVLDETTEECYVYRNEGANQILAPEQELTLPDILPDFRVVVHRFFE